METPKFVHLHTHSHYSLLDGLPKIEALIKKTKELGMDSIALTDHGYMYGIIEFYKTAKKLGIKPIIGVEIYVSPREVSMKEAGIDDKRYHLILLAKNNVGYKNLIKLVTRASLDGFYYKPRVDRAMIRKYSDGLIALSGCMSGEIPRAILTKDFKKAEDTIKEYKEIFGNNFYLEISDRPHIKISDTVNKKIIEYAQKFNVQLVATCDVHYLEKEDAKAQDTLMAVQTGAKLGEGDRITLAQDDFSLKSPDEIYRTFPYTKEALLNTVKIAELCNVDIKLGITQLPQYEVPEGDTPESYLKELCVLGLKKRYGDLISDKINERLLYELSVIDKTGFATYFLIVQDFVNWAKDNKIVVGPGRGSAAGSLVAYLLNITNIDPLEYDLLFERFLNPERVSMPDIDLDFADTRRDEVLNYVVEKYGQDRVAQIITFGTMAARAAIRDTGRALGMNYEFCDKLAKLIEFGTSLKESLKNVTEFKELYEQNSEAKALLDAAKKLEGIARHASTHACAVVIAKEPLDEIVPLQYATKSQDDSGNAKKDERKQVVTQYEMHAIEDLGLLKMDFLGLKNLSIIERTLKIVKARQNIDIDIDKIPLNDKQTFKLFQDAKTTGIFQMESSGMKRYLKELKPTELEDLIAMVALYRPGPMELIPDFIARKNGLKKVIYLHPKLEPILKNTYGVGVYQEQMMRIARDLAGFSLAEADILRKAIGKKIKELLNEQEARLVSGMVKNGIGKQIAQKIWDMFPPFARYGFNRSHAACYGLVGYQTAYLKSHFPAEFMASLMTADLRDIERIAFLVEEAETLGIKVLAPSVNKSYRDFAVISADRHASIDIAQQNSAESEIRFGLVAIKGVGENIANAIIEERKRNGIFKSLEDFLIRIEHKDLNKKSLESLIKAGALDEFNDRALLYTNLESILNFVKNKSKENIETPQMGLFSTPEKPDILILKLNPPVENISKKEILLWEKELLGLYVSGHPLFEHKEALEKNTLKIKNLTDNIVGKSIKLGGMISGIKKIVTKKGDPMAFAQLEDFTGKIELVIFPKMLEKNKEFWQEDKIALISGKLDLRDGSYKIICDTAKELK
ncbi:MAG: DNA polymerase III subunit alpha [Patescibacteria group bacterium]